MAFWEPRSAALTVRRILKVNHAGEFGAIRIYNAQLALARRLYLDIVPALTEMRDDEIEHFRLFRDAMPVRDARPCRVMAFWSLGGYVLGFVTALLGRNMIWVCTEAVEATVHRHLEDQMAFLEQRDPPLCDLIGSIQAQELAHLQHAVDHQPRQGFARAVTLPLIALATESLIWLSTWGDSTSMHGEIARLPAPSPALGKALIATARAHLGPELPVALYVNDGNAAAIAFYRSQGFEVEQHVPVQMGPYQFTDYVMVNPGNTGTASPVPVAPHP